MREELSIDEAQRKAAKIAGLAYPISFATVVAVNFGIFARLIVRNNPSETARNILANEQLFRIGIAGDLVYCVGVIIVLAALYIILRPVDRNLALMAALGRLVHAFSWIVVSVNLFTALRLLNDPVYPRIIGQEQVEALARLHLSGSDQYYVGLLFWSLAVTIVSVLWLRSGYIPKVFGAAGLVSGSWCAACTFIFFVFPGFENAVNLWWFDSPMVIVEIATSFWLLIKGLKTVEQTGMPADSAPAKATARR